MNQPTTTAASTAFASGPRHHPARAVRSPRPHNRIRLLHPDTRCAQPGPPCARAQPFPSRWVAENDPHERRHRATASVGPRSGRAWRGPRPPPTPVGRHMLSRRVQHLVPCIELRDLTSRRKRRTHHMRAVHVSRGPSQRTSAAGGSQSSVSASSRRWRCAPQCPSPPPAARTERGRLGQGRTGQRCVVVQPRVGPKTRRFVVGEGAPERPGARCRVVRGHGTRSQSSTKKRPWPCERKVPRPFS